MITALVRQNLTRLCFKNPSSVCKSRVTFSVFLLHFSTSVERQTDFHPPVSEFLLHKHHFSPEAALRVASVLTGLRNPENSDSVLSFLKEIGFSKTQVEKVVKCMPELLSANLEKMIKPKIKIFQDLSISANGIARIISKDPWILKHSVNNRIIPSLSVLKSLLGSNAEVAKVLNSSGWFLTTNLDNSLLPNVEFLKNCGIAMDQIIWAMYYFPRFLLRKPEIVKKFVDKADEMGVSRSSKMFIHAVRIFSSLSEETWELKLRTFRKLGFSDDDIAAAFRNAPLVFGVSEEKIKEVNEVLLATGKYKLPCIVNNPTAFMYSVEKRYKPRLKVLELLESKNMIENWPSVSTLCRMPDKKFHEKFVGPYFDEVGDVYMAKSAPSGKREVKQKLSA